jgi:hypothetical protein
MTRSRYGMIAGIAGAALAAWWWNRNRGMAAQRATAGRGEVIFHNHPATSSEGIL